MKTALVWVLFVVKCALAGVFVGLLVATLASAFVPAREPIYKMHCYLTADGRTAALVTAHWGLSGDQFTFLRASVLESCDPDVMMISLSQGEEA